MKNIYILPTDKPSRLLQSLSTIELLDEEWLSPIGNVNRNIYITSDEEIKRGDWCFLQKDSKEYVYKCTEKPQNPKHWGLNIILTTDQDLIKDGVQAIDDEFLEWFVKNPSCESVEVKLEVGSLRWSHSKNTYKIIIPKEESKQIIESVSIGEETVHIITYEPVYEEPKQETLEEAKLRQLFKNRSNCYADSDDVIQAMDENCFIKTIKEWQQERSYSEEEVKNIVDETIEKFYKHFYTLTKAEMKEQWFEQFKKK